MVIKQTTDIRAIQKGESLEIPTDIQYERCVGPFCQLGQVLVLPIYKSAHGNKLGVWIINMYM